MSQEKNYNGVTIEKSWSFMAFVKEFGKPKLAHCINKETNEKFDCIAFDNGKEENNITFAHFGYSTQGMTTREIVEQKDKLKVGLNTSGKYTVYKQNEQAWEDIDLDGLF